ncbi:MAG: type VI secretion system protein TssA [Alphaproteobacteria bacterium]|nr:type VI secretion system protein TssA [Alphaproteobacteria bacterium]
MKDLRIQNLCEPISADKPSGEYLFYEDTYLNIKEALHQDDSLPKGMWSFNEKSSDWKKAERICEEALLKRTKDIQIVGWLTQCWLQQYGLEGLLGGIDLMKKICEKFWDTVYPTIEEEEDFRARVFEWMNVKIAPQIRMIPMFFSSKTLDFSLPAHYFNIAQNVLSGAHNIPENHHHITKDWQDGILAVQASSYAPLIKTVEKVEVALHDLSDWLDENFVHEQVTFNYFYKELERLRDAVEHIKAVKKETSSEIVEEEQSAPPPPPQEPSQEPSSQDQVEQELKKAPPVTEDPVVEVVSGETRHTLYKQLRGLVQHLKTVDPQSPIAGLLEKILLYETYSFEDIVSKYGKKGALRRVKEILEEDLDHGG